MPRCCSTLETSAYQLCKLPVALTNTTTSAWTLSSMETCHCCHLELKLPWSPSRRSTSTTHRVHRVPYKKMLASLGKRGKTSHSLFLLFPVVTSTSVREFTVVSAERGSESYTIQMKQNITYRDCYHANHASIPETLQITMERVFVMYVKEERILRYAVTNKISPVGGEWPHFAPVDSFPYLLAPFLRFASSHLGGRGVSILYVI